VTAERERRRGEDGHSHEHGNPAACVRVKHRSSTTEITGAQARARSQQRAARAEPGDKDIDPRQVGEDLGARALVVRPRVLLVGELVEDEPVALAR